MEQKRENWGSRLGFIMAAAGSAVGLGNIWRFPYTAGENGGGAFILIYLAFVFVIGISVMIAELSLGRSANTAAVGAFKKYDNRWTFVGVMGVLSAFLIMGFYPVVGGWSLAYIFKSFTGLVSDPSAVPAIFDAFIANPIEPIGWMLVYLFANVAIVAKGISGGIEKAGKVLMPMLFGLLVLLSIRSVTLPGAGAGMEFLLKPDFTKVTGETFLAALGQAFFSLSLGMGAIITYGSYLGSKENLPQNAFIITALDTVVALLAGVAIFPALFAFGLEPAAGPGLVFVVVPTIFAQMGGLGVIFSALFFVALSVAALTSSVSLLETVTAYLIDQRGMKRKKAVYSTGAVMVVTNLLSSLSMGVLAGVTVLGAGFFDFFDILTDKIFLAIGGMLLSIFVGWFMNKEDLKSELTSGGLFKFGLFNIWYALVKFVIPVAILLVAIGGIISITQTSLMIFGLLIILVLAIFSKKLA